MVIENELKEVRFDIYCEKCKFAGTSESEDPCFECLDEPVNIDSEKPVNYKES